MSPSAPLGHVGEVLSGCSIAVIAGTGGVGKTTVSAALALAAGRELEGDTLVLTIDPARRLATALGIEIEGNEAHEIPGSKTRDGRVFAAMLDPGPAWDRLIVEAAPDAATADAILVNPVYRRIADTFVHGNDYAALSWLDEALAADDYRLIIVDTPPSQSALGLFDAPGQVESFFTSNLLGWLTQGEAGTFLGGAAAKSFGQLADRVLGAQFFGAVADFFTLMQGVVPGMVERTARVADELAGDDSRFLAVAAPTPTSVHGVLAFADELVARGLVLDGAVVNGVEPAVFSSPKTLDVAERVLAGTSSPFSKRLTTALGPGAEYVIERGRVAAAQDALLDELRPTLPTLSVPRLVHSPNSAESLEALGLDLWSADPAAP